MIIHKIINNNKIFLLDINKMKKKANIIDFAIE